MGFGALNGVCAFRFRCISDVPIVKGSAARRTAHFVKTIRRIGTQVALKANCKVQASKEVQRNDNPLYYNDPGEVSICCYNPVYVANPYKCSSDLAPCPVRRPRPGPEARLLSLP